MDLIWTVCAINTPTTTVNHDQFKEIRLGESKFGYWQRYRYIVLLLQIKFLPLFIYMQRH